MSRKLVWLLFGLLTIMSVSLFSVSAQGSSPDTWPVEERCVGEPTLPPNGWTYPGMILMSGYAGIHGIQQDWATPHVVAFFRQDAEGSEPLNGGQLSPDGRWHAVPIGESWTEVSFNTYWDVGGLHVYSTSDDGIILDFDLADYEDIFAYYPVAWGYLPVQWMDNESLIIGSILLHPFEGMVQAAEFDLWDSILYDRFISPDSTLAYGGKGFGGVYRIGLYELTDPQTTMEELLDDGYVEGVAWRHDSSGFIAAIEDKAQDWHGLADFSREGVLLDHIFDLADSRIDFRRTMSGRNDLGWSTDHEYYAFTLDAPYPDPNRLYIVDWEAHVVIDTCLSPFSSPVWSPDGNMLTYLAPAPVNYRVVVLDMETRQAYDIARQSGAYPALGGLGPDMIGWRSAAGE